MKEVTASVSVSCSVQDLFGLIYLDATTCREYHAKENGDPHADVGPWIDGTRVVCFATPLKAPAMIKRTLGLETLRVREQSRAETQPDGSIVITSLPIVDVPGGDRFKTTAVTRIDPRPEGGCQIRTSACCEAAGPWGMVGTIEELMAKEALQTIERFLEFARHRCEQHFGVQGASVVDTDEFHDADTGLPRLVQMPPGLLQEQAVSQFLRDVSGAVQGLAAETHLLRERLGNLEEDIKALRSSGVGRSSSSSSSRRALWPGVSGESWPPVLVLCLCTMLGTAGVTIVSMLLAQRFAHRGSSSRSR